MLRSRRRRKATKTFTEFIFGIVAYQFVHLISAHWLIWSLTFTFCYAPNLSGMVTGGENDRRRRTEQPPLIRSVINLTRFDIESTPNRHRNNISPRTLTLFSIRWRHSRYADVILDTLMSFSIHWRHSWYADVTLDALTSFPLRWRDSWYANAISVYKMSSPFFNGDPW